MIAFIRGPLASVDEHAAVVDVNGVGYRLVMTVSGLGAIASMEGECFVHTYTHVREDTLDLFGFLDPDELGAFKILIGINGVGPKLAIQILGAISVAELSHAVAANDMVRLKALPGIGKKTAERLIMELRDKPLGSGILSSPGGPGTPGGPGGLLNDLRSAMENLGYRGVKLEKALQVLSERASDWTLEEGVREALSLLR